jgi:hypothetical protein
MCRLSRQYGNSKVVSLDCSRMSVIPVDVETLSNALSLLLRRENKGLKRHERKLAAGDGGASIFLGVGMSRVVEILSPLCSLLAGVDGGSFSSSSNEITYGIAVSGYGLE